MLTVRSAEPCGRASSRNSFGRRRRNGRTGTLDVNARHDLSRAEAAADGTRAFVDVPLDGERDQHRRAIERFDGDGVSEIADGAQATARPDDGRDQAMNAQCERYRELAADVVNGVAEPAQVDRLEEHVADCAECRAYLEALRREDLLLAELVERLDTGMAGRRERLVGAIKGQHKQTRRSMKWSINMTSPLARMAAAAAIVFVVVLGAVFFPGSNVTFATVVEPILNAKTVIVDLVVGGEDGPVMHEIIVGGRIRRNMSNLPTLTQVLDLEGGRMLALDDTSKTAIYVDIAGDVQEGTKNYVEFLRQAIRQVQDAHVEGLGEREIDGVAAVGFVGRGENEEVTIWADRQDRASACIELTMGRDFRGHEEFPVRCARMLLVSMDVPEDIRWRYAG